MNGFIEWGIFLALSTVAIVTAAGMIITMSMYRAGLALMASFVALAGLFILLDADLLAAIQVMMNVGGMLVMVLFMVMMMMDPGGEMMWGMKRDMHMGGPGAFSMHMPWGKPPADNQAEQQAQVKDWTCPMHPEISEPTTGTCPKCGMTLIPRAEAMSEQSMQEMDMTGMEFMDHDTSTMPMEHTSHAMPEPTMSSMTMDHESNGENQSVPTMDMSHHDMDMGGMSMSPRQNYDMMVDMAMSTTQLPWAIILGILSALLLIILVIFTPWPLATIQPTQDATTAVGQLLLSRYMIAFEGAAFLILAGIAGAVLLAKRERPEVTEQQEQSSEKERMSMMGMTSTTDTRIFSCPMHAEVRQQGPGKCPKCGMSLLPDEAAVASNVQDNQGGQSSQPTQGGHS